MLADEDARDYRYGQLAKKVNKLTAELAQIKIAVQNPSNDVVIQSIIVLISRLAGSQFPANWDVLEPDDKADKINSYADAWDLKLDNYALKTDIPIVPPVVDLSPYALITDLPVIPDLTPYATKTNLTTAFDDYDENVIKKRMTDLNDALTEEFKLYDKKEDVNSKLTDYVTKTELDNKGLATEQSVTAKVDELNNTITEELKSYDKKEDVNSKLTDYLTLQEFYNERLMNEDAVTAKLEDYALKNDIPTPPDLTPYATKTDLNNSLATYDTNTAQPRMTDLNNALAEEFKKYDKKEDVNAKLTDYVTKTDLDTRVENEKTSISDGVDAKLDDLNNALAEEFKLYDKKEDVNSKLTDYVTKTDLDTRVENEKTSISDGVDAKLDDLNNALAEEFKLYDKKEDVNAKLNNYVTKQELTNNGFATNDSVDTKLQDYALASDIPTMPDLTPYALKTDLTDPGVLDLSEYAKKTDLIGPNNPANYTLKSEFTEYTEGAFNYFATKADLNLYLPIDQVQNYVTGVSQLDFQAAIADRPRRDEVDVILQGDYGLLPVDVLQNQPDSAVYVTHTGLQIQLASLGAATLSQYALKTELPDLTPYALSSDVTEINTRLYSYDGRRVIFANLGDVGVPVTDSGWIPLNSANFTCPLANFVTSYSYRRVGSSRRTTFKVTWNNQGYSLVPIVTVSNFLDTLSDSQNDYIAVIIGSLTPTSLEYQIEEMYDNQYTNMYANIVFFRGPIYNDL